MKPAECDPRVFVVDDDVAFSESVAWLLGSVDLDVSLFHSVHSFFESVTTDDIGCIVTDVRMPGTGGLELQRMVSEKGLNLPVIVMTAHGDIDTAVLAMKGGAIDFIQKPFNDQKFIDLVQRAISTSIENASAVSKDADVLEKLERLTPREHQVLDLIVDGNTNKQIAERFSISEKTVEAHRAQVMQKTGANSLADLIKMAIRYSRT